jgi:methionyl aminopeptidase
MSIETRDQLEAMKRAGRVVRLVLERMRRAVKPGITTAELNEIGGQVMRENGARSAPRLVYGFPADTLISVNDAAVHGIPGARVLCDGDLVKLDVTVEKDGFMADAAVTVGVGEVPEHRLRLISAARAAFARAMEVARPGVRVAELGRAIEAEVHSRGLQVVRELAGHGIGRTIHEPPSVPNFYEPRDRSVLTEGMVIAVEPIVAERSGRMVADADGWTLRTRDGGYTAHYEHTVVITRGKPLLLTAA